MRSALPRCRTFDSEDDACREPRDDGEGDLAALAAAVRELRTRACGRESAKNDAWLTQVEQSQGGAKGASSVDRARSPGGCLETCCLHVRAQVRLLIHARISTVEPAATRARCASRRWPVACGPLSTA
eukprot:4040646-Pleurochrysis_carterae.AAC.4